MKITIEQYTHKKINQKISGIPIEIEEGYSKVKLEASHDMILDETGLIHGGYTFGLADFAAMIAVNHPNVVLGGAQVRFVEPVKEGQIMIAEAQLMNVEDGKLIIDVNVTVEEKVVFIGEFICFAPEKHVLDEGKK